MNVMPRMQPAKISSRDRELLMMLPTPPPVPDGLVRDVFCAATEPSKLPLPFTELLRALMAMAGVLQLPEVDCAAADQCGWGRTGALCAAGGALMRNDPTQGARTF